MTEYLKLKILKNRCQCFEVILINNIVTKFKSGRLFFICLSVLFLGILFNCAVTLLPTWDVDSNSEISITIERGMNPVQIAQLLKDYQIIQSTRQFLWGAKLMGADRKLQAGTYSFQGRTNNYQIIRKLVKGRVITEQIMFHEGIRATQIAAIVYKKMGIDSTTFMQLAENSEYTHSLDIQADRLEGYLFPNTYRFYTDATAQEVIERMVHELRIQFNDSLVTIARQMGLSVHDVLTLASIVEGEAIHDDERPIIAAIYFNRLEKGWPLQACPTVQYLLPEGPRHLLKKDLEIDSPYNTYKHRGLPPGPVNNPGMASILAVLNPAQVDYLYLVANGDGSHTFSKTMDEHLTAKSHFDRIRRFYSQ